MRDLEYKNDNAPGQQGNKDCHEFTIQTGRLKLVQNGLKGDFIRVITRAPTTVVVEGTMM